MIHDDFEMENQGYEEECPSGNHGSFVSSGLPGRSSPISRRNDRPLRNDPEETHVYEDISPARTHETAETLTRLPVARDTDLRADDTDLFGDSTDSNFWSRQTDLDIRKNRSVEQDRPENQQNRQDRQENRQGRQENRLAGEDRQENRQDRHENRQNWQENRQNQQDRQENRQNWQDRQENRQDRHENRQNWQENRHIWQDRQENRQDRHENRQNWEDRQEDRYEDDTVTSNFQRNLTLPLRGPTDREASADRANRYSVRVTNRERRSRENHVSGENDVKIDLECREDEDDQPRDRLSDKPGRRRRKKDCKRCNKTKIVSGFRDELDFSSRIVQANNAINERDDKGRLADRTKTIDSFDQLPPHRPALQRIPETRNNSIFSISNNVNSVTGSPKPINYDKNETDLLRLTPVELNDDRALITPQKNRNGMKVNSIYSQDHWRPKDLPIFFTDVKEQTFQRAYSLPTRTHTPTSQNRVNLRRSVRGEPPPHPARLRKNRHGWTLHFGRPLDATGCTRSIVLLFIAVLALLSIGAIALYIVFEPEKLQIIQQYLRSSTPNVTREETNSSFTADLVDPLVDRKVETTTFDTPPSTTQLSETFPSLPPETTLPSEPEVEITTTSIVETTTQSDRNVTRYCDDCYEGEACVALVDEEVPVCRVGPDRTDPTGCNGLCLINKQKCHRLDFDAFRCVEVEHYCLEDEWTCANTLCIPLVKHCDGHMNCYDHSDEYDCDCNLETHFQCGNETSCLPLERRCDGKIDCWDATDEMNCTLACPSNSEFTCSNGECIRKARFCDGLRDCTDGSDEPHGCQGRCNKHEFSCQNGRCITKGTKCNGFDDCGDGSDEQHCRDRIYKKVT